MDLEGRFLAAIVIFLAFLAEMVYNIVPFFLAFLEEIMCTISCHSWRSFAMALFVVMFCFVLSVPTSFLIMSLHAIFASAPFIFAFAGEFIIQ